MIREKFYIEGGIPLSGTVRVSGSKNAALPILAASILVGGNSRISDVPEIDDTISMMEILEILGVKITRDKNSITFNTESIQFPKQGKDFSAHIKKMRASILLLAPLLIRFGSVRIPFPGGCVLGKRPAKSHFMAFEAFGAKVEEDGDMIVLSSPKKLSPATVVLPEISVTATENAVMVASAIEGKSEIRMAAAEPHVQNLCEFLVSAGAKIEGIGTHTLHVWGTKHLKNGKISIASDYLEAGTFLLAGAVTNGEITVQNVEEHDLDSFFQKLREVGVNFELFPDRKEVRIHRAKKEFHPVKIQTGVFPAFPTDLHPQFAVLLTKCQGTSHIFETLFERKFAYLLELEKMGADVEIMNPHQFLIHGGKRLQGTSVASQDIRAGAAMLLAALAAEGETEISNIHYIHRGYQNIEGKLKSLGAKIERKTEKF
ncbi:UDP-N-acetylglucosamine 1-carboxyvinyltransferase [Candidatus Peregrinibacteria bacterium]|nr:UDP-N-acetylglucosamine 1-carboxyvinyltransferase [Candidatus Peregrinibacteria bacterium]